MNSLINFYSNKIPYKSGSNYNFDTVMTWDDYEMEVKTKYIYWLFPDSTESVSDVPVLDKSDIEHFKKDYTLRFNAVRASLKMLDFYGFDIDKRGTGIVQIKNIKRTEKGVVIGLFSIHNYDRLTRIMNFLNLIDMEYLSSIFFLCLCQTLKNNIEFSTMVTENGYLYKWILTQKYLLKYDNNMIFNALSNKEVSLSNKKVMKSDNLESLKICINGLDYASNSCYMDSSLLCIFAINNTTINDQILNKNLDDLKMQKTLDIKCSSDINYDIERRKRIQTELVSITEYMRGLKKNTEATCSNLRVLFSKCKGPQPFHKTGTQDAGEFLTYLFNIFQVENAMEHKKIYGSYNGKWNLVRDEKFYRSPIITITSYEISLMEGLDITSVLNKEEEIEFDADNYWNPMPGVVYKTKKEEIMIDAPLLIFKLERMKDLDILEKSSLLIPEMLTTEKRTLSLSSMVVHNGGAHYTANIKCGDNWWFYDDNPSKNTHKFILLGSYENMLNNKYNKPLTLGTLFFYF